MEGSRHERAATVTVSYGIGFITAFILYASYSASPIADTFVKAVVPGNTAITANIYNAVEQSNISEPDTAVVAQTAVAEYRSGQLTVLTNGTEKILSFNPKTTDLKADLSTLAQGYHYGELEFEVSADNQFVFFCERQSEEKSSCLGYVYSIATDTIHPVVKEGKPVTISDVSAKTASWTQATLTIGQYYSVNEMTPWVLADESPKLDLD
jgi:hypothetical protein